MFIVLEGIDGCGKTTQANLLRNFLTEEGHSVFLTAEPSNNKIGKFIKKILSSDYKLDPRALALLFTADRYEHIINEIKPAISRGMIVISERYYYSTIAYQAAQGVDVEFLENINSFAIRNKPDLTILLDIKPEMAIPNIREKDKKFREMVEKAYKKYENARRHYLRNRRALYGKIAEKKAIRELLELYKKFELAEDEYEREKKKYLRFEKFEKPTTLEANKKNYEKFLSRVRENYLRFERDENVVRINASKSKELVFDDIKREVSRILYSQ
ncbi:MAG: dTMP kinase [Candidatus Altiarchaeales archaeon]|nr:MAG: dTMP kinase [Candidatus Altiarchaeales archaeon]